MASNSLSPVNTSLLLLSMNVRSKLTRSLEGVVALAKIIYCSIKSSHMVAEYS